MHRIAPVIVLLLIVLSVAEARAGEPFPDLVLEGWLPAFQREYLGVDDDPPSLSDIRTGYILIEIMNMYCSHCQLDAPTVNEVYQYLDNRGYSSRVKMVVIAAGNSQFEVDFFRNKYSVPMPIFTDQNYVAYRAVGGMGTPYFFLVRKHEDGRLESVFSKAGHIKDKDRFIKAVLVAAGYNG